MITAILLSATIGQAVVIPDTVPTGALVKLDIPLREGQKAAWIFRDRQSFIVEHQSGGERYLTLAFSSGREAGQVSGAYFLVDDDVWPPEINWFDIRVSPPDGVSDGGFGDDNPFIPPDKFGNIGQRACTWGMDMDERARSIAKTVGANYAWTADDLEAERIGTIAAGINKVSERNNTVFLANPGAKEQYDQWAKKVNDVYQQYWGEDGMTKSDVVAFFRAVAAGLGSVQ